MHSDSRPPTSVVMPVVVLGFSVALAVWCAAFIAHLPWIDLVGRVTGPVVVIVWLGAAVIAGRAAPYGRVLLTGALSGLVTAILCLLILGAALVEQPQSGDPAPGTAGLRPGMLGMVPAFLALGCVIGLLGALVGSRFRRTEAAASPDWLFRFAVIAALAVVPLLISGGAVTSTESGMAIRGWPSSDAANIFLYPISLMADPKRYLEHSHRLFGTFLGLTSITLCFLTWSRDRRPAARLATTILLIAVIAQGVVGGLRVLEDNKAAGMVHGIGAQLVWAFAVTIAATLSPAWKSSPAAVPTPGAGRLHVFANAVALAMLIQLSLGAAYRHLKDVSPGANHALYTHIAFSVILMILAIPCGLRAARTAGDGGRILRRTGKGLVHTVGLQFLLGWVAFISILTSPTHGEPPPPPGAGPIKATLFESVSTVAHQANGALVLALVSLLWIWSRRLLARPPGA